MGEVSTLRLYVLRAGYLLIVVGLAAMIWPGIVSHSDDVPHMNTAVRSLLGGVSLLALIGIRYPASAENAAGTAVRAGMESYLGGRIRASALAETTPHRPLCRNYVRMYLWDNSDSGRRPLAVCFPPLHQGAGRTLAGWGEQVTAFVA